MREFRFVGELGDSKNNVFDCINRDVSADIEMKREDFLQDRTEVVRHDDEEASKVTSIRGKISRDLAGKFGVIEETAEEEGTVVNDVFDDSANTIDTTFLCFVDENTIERRRNHARNFAENRSDRHMEVHVSENVVAFFSDNELFSKLELSSFDQGLMSESQIFANVTKIDSSDLGRAIYTNLAVEFSHVVVEGFVGGACQELKLTESRTKSVVKIGQFEEQAHRATNQLVIFVATRIQQHLHHLTEIREVEHWVVFESREFVSQVGEHSCSTGAKIHHDIEDFVWGIFRDEFRS